MFKFSVLFICLSICSSAKAQQEDDVQTIEELKNLVETAKHDSTKINALWQWDDLIYFSDANLDSSLLAQIVELCKLNLKKELQFQEKLFFGQNLAKGLNYLGSACTSLGYYAEAVDLHKEAIPVYQQLNQMEGLDGNYINLGTAAYDNGDFQEGIKFFNLGIKVTDKTGNTGYRANALMSLGNIYTNQGDYDKSLNYFHQAIKFHIENENQLGQEITYLNMGNAYLSKNDLDSAYICYHLSLKIGQEIEDYYTLGTSMNNLGEVYLKMNKMDSSFYFYTAGMNYRTELNQQSDLVYSYSGLCLWYVADKNGSKAVEYGERAYNLAKTMNTEVDMVPAAQSLEAAYEFVGNYKGALEIHRVLEAAQDSIKNMNNQKALISREIEYAYEKNKIADSLAFEQQKAVDDLAHQNQLDKDAQERYVLYGGLAGVLLLGGFAYRGYRRKKADNEIISEQKRQAESQKEQIEEAHKEITDSIAYAKRIQSAILPPAKMVKDYLPNSFILYKPKDVVAGDFYWMEKVGDCVLFAAADCTGHGVPGAMVSVVCNGAMNRAVREFGLTDPGQILDKTRDIVIQEFEKSEEEVKDGMDIALCGIKGTKLTYSGANNPLWIVRDGEVIETKADKQPIGKFDAAKPFTSHEVDLLKGDMIYIFSDGFVDQFGGDKGKKFKAKALRELLLSVQELSASEQHDKLDAKFEAWRGDLEQIDDVCFIGVKV